MDSGSVAGGLSVSIEGVSEERGVVGSGDDVDVDAINGSKSSGHLNHGDYVAGCQEWKKEYLELITLLPTLIPHTHLYKFKSDSEVRVFRSNFVFGLWN